MSASSPSVSPTGPRIAVVVCHGMGQQVAFETLGSVAAEVADHLGIPGSEIGTTLVSHDDRYLARAELSVPRGDDTALVHFYECYWAPLVEGKVNLLDTLRFLVEAGLQGLRFALQSGEFDRSMFHRQRRFEIPARRVYQFAIAVWVLWLLGMSYLCLGLAYLSALVHLFGLHTARTPHTATFLTACWTFLFTVVASATYGAILSMLWVGVLSLARAGSQPRSTTDPAHRVASLLPLRVLSLAFGVLLILHEIDVARRERIPDILAWMLAGQPHARSIVSLIVLSAALYGVTRFLVDFVGDVAAYVSPYKVSKFQEIRTAIQTVGRGVAQFVYTTIDETGGPFYDEVYFVGHSLGSVVAYDSLDDALARDARADGWAQGTRPAQFDVAGRTRLLLTFGSPLDKTAFVFRTQGRREPSVREKIAALVQPLIVDHAFRRNVRWINLWSPFDWISGSLEFYDDRDAASSPDAANDDVRNLRSPANVFPWWAHTGYWTRPLMPAVIVRAITGNAPPGSDAKTTAALDRAFT